MDDQGIQPGAFEFVAEPASGFGGGQRTRQWGFGPNGMAASTGQDGPGEEARGEDQQVFRSEGIDPLGVWANK